MDEYYLFLDESKPNSNFKNFTLGGIVAKKEIYENSIKPIVQKVKRDCFGDENIILHEAELRKKEGNFASVTGLIQKKFFEEIKKVFKKEYLNVLAVTVDVDALAILYPDSARNDIYYISLQLLLENYAHFLTNNNGIGSIYLESTEPTSDSHLQNLYYTLLANGTLFLKKEFLQSRLKTINFQIKSDNIIGLQLADLVPNSIARNSLNMKQKPFSLFNEIEEVLYDGGIGKRERFGCKKIS